jgi:hypothetical protein
MRKNYCGMVEIKRHQSMKPSGLSRVWVVQVFLILLTWVVFEGCAGVGNDDCADAGDSGGVGAIGVTDSGGRFPTTWYVRPADDGNGTDFTYGASDGTSPENAFDGFADIAGLAPGDTVCLPGGDEPFFERLDVTTAGRAGFPITYAGCGTTPAVIWSAQGLTGNRSFNCHRAVTTGVAYGWATVGADTYRKRIDVRPLVLWEDNTWLQPVDIHLLSETTILTTLQAGQWGVHDESDGTFRIYYKATVTGNSPTTTVIRCDNVPLSDGVPAAMVLVDLPHQRFDNIEIRGHAATKQAWSMLIIDTHDIVLQSVLFYRNFRGPAIISIGVASSDIWWNAVSVLYSSGTGASITPGLGMDNINIIGGSYSYSTGITYNGSGFSTNGDGDGIGIGYEGGRMSNLLIQNIEANYNSNYGVFIGTSNAMTVTNVSLLASRFIGNMRGCFGESTLAQTVGTLMVKGFVCQDSHGPDRVAAMYFTLPYSPSSVRSVIVADGIFIGNENPARILYQPHRNSHYQFSNLVFTANPGNGVLDYGDLYSDKMPLIGNEMFSDILFYSHPNQPGFSFASIGTSKYLYSIPGDLTAFNTVTGATGIMLNIDPQLTSPTDLRPTASSPLRKNGLWWGDDCVDARGRSCWVISDSGISSN